MKFNLFIVFIVIIYKQCDCAKILGLFPAPSKSHVFLGHALLSALAKHGHEVTMVSPYPMSKKPPPNYRDIAINDLKSVITDLQKKWNPNYTENNFFEDFNGNPISIVTKVYEMGHAISEAALQDPKLQRLINSKTEHFDVVICEVFMNEAFFAFADHFNAISVAFSTIGASEWTNDLMGNPSPYAYVPEIFLGFTDRMTFVERIINTGVSILNELILNYKHLPGQEELRERFLPHTKPLNQILSNVSLLFLNSHPSLSNPRPFVPNTVEIGGFHVDPPQPLPQDLKKIIDEAPNGVVYFSMGSNLESSKLPKEVRDAFLKSLSELKETVLWKWEDENLPNKPKNIIIRKWFPQQDILAHPKVKLFITHGGLLSTFEAVSRGVPLIGIPVFADQNLNMGKARSMGYGEMIAFNNVTYESLSWALKQVLTNPKYTENVKYRSAVLNDRPLATDKEINYWIEYVIRHKGANHLRTARNELNLFQYLLLDIVSSIFLILITILLIIYAIARFILKKICKCQQKVSKTSSSKKNN